MSVLKGLSKHQKWTSAVFPMTSRVLRFWHDELSAPNIRRKKVLDMGVVFLLPAHTSHQRKAFDALAKVLGLNGRGQSLARRKNGK